MGTPDFSVPVLDALVGAGHEAQAALSEDKHVEQEELQ